MELKWFISCVWEISSFRLFWTVWYDFESWILLASVFRRMWTVSSITPRTATALKSVCASRLNAAVGKATRARRACATTPSTSTRPSRLTSCARCSSRAGLRANPILHAYVPSLAVADCIWYLFSALFLFNPPCPPRGRPCPLIPPLHEETCTPSFNSSIRKTLSLSPSFHTSFRRFSLSSSFHLLLWRVNAFTLLIPGAPVLPLHYALNCMHLFFCILLSVLCLFEMMYNSRVCSFVLLHIQLLFLRCLVLLLT